MPFKGARNAAHCAATAQLKRASIAAAAKQSRFATAALRHTQRQRWTPTTSASRTGARRATTGGGGDTADLEIGQKDEDAVEEEALARSSSARRRGAGRGRLRLDGGDDDEVEEETPW